MTAPTALENRIAKLQRHLAKWARRTGVTCYRVYERDLPDQPLIVDWYDGDAVVWLYRRTRDETEAAHGEFVAAALDSVARGLELAPERVVAKERRVQEDRQAGAGQYGRLGEAGRVKSVRERELTFEVNLSDYLDVGLFLDHRPTRQLVEERARDLDVLNLFAYTGSFTVAAIRGGARSSTTVDLSNTYLDWAARNFQHNDFAPSDRHRLVRADALRFLDEAVAAPRRYGLIVCDPPTFSNSKGMEHDFAVERDHAGLIERCLALLAAGGALLFSTNARGFELDRIALAGRRIDDWTARTTPEDYKGRTPHQCFWITPAPR